ncbi:hypothetical protein B0H14DRAFT_3130669 [Mycena olivaceomarginata]|nr:hypothetical protein B0H14DRAFT_3130669 [Mycena olivaceomarginata]
MPANPCATLYLPSPSIIPLAPPATPSVLLPLDRVHCLGFYRSALTLSPYRSVRPLVSLGRPYPYTPPNENSGSLVEAQARDLSTHEIFAFSRFHDKTCAGLRSRREMCSPTIKWDVKSTLFPLTELDGTDWNPVVGWSLSEGLITWTYTRRLLEQVPILGSTSNAVSLESYGLGASVPDVPVDGVIRDRGVGIEIEEGRCTNPNQRWRYDGYRTDEDTNVVRTMVETIGLSGADGDLNLVASLRACFLQSDARENGDPNQGSLNWRREEGAREVWEGHNEAEKPQNTTRALGTAWWSHRKALERSGRGRDERGGGGGVGISSASSAGSASGTGKVRPAREVVWKRQQKGSATRSATGGDRSYRGVSAKRIVHVEESVGLDRRRCVYGLAS